MSDYTPGPWEAHFEEAIRVKNKDGTVAVATNLHLHGRRDISEAEANALLIAAAPELLEALEHLLSGYKLLVPDVESCSNAYDAEQAIAKARGNEDGE